MAASIEQVELKIEVFGLELKPDELVIDKDRISLGMRRGIVDIGSMVSDALVRHDFSQQALQDLHEECGYEQDFLLRSEIVTMRDARQFTTARVGFLSTRHGLRSFNHRVGSHVARQFWTPPYSHIDL